MDIGAEHIPSDKRDAREIINPFGIDSILKA
jgi:hypothetical protein